MESLSYNEEKNKENKIRHIFYPDKFAIIVESVIAIVILIVFNATELSNRLLGTDINNENPISYSLSQVGIFLNTIQKYYVVEQISLFLLWAIAGALFYIFVFRFFQIIFGVSYSLNKGVNLYKKEHSSGLMKWFNSLHDFFLKALIFISGIFIFFIAILACLGIASQELRAGLIYSFPSNLFAIILSFLAAIICVRLIIISISLISARFRTWYTVA